MSTSSRSTAIDLVRVIVLTAVVTRHTWYDPEGLVARVICPGTIAVFFVLSGYFWSNRRTLADEIDNRATGLLVPYVAWMLLIGIPLYTWAATQLPLKEALTLAAAAVYGPQFAAAPLSVAWFFTTMFFALVLLRALSTQPRAVTWALLVVIMAVTVVAPHSFRYLPLAAGLALPCLIYVVAGQELRRFRTRITHPALIGFALLVVCALATAAGAAHDTAGTLIEIKSSDYGFPVLGLLNGVGIAFGLILLLESAENLIPDALRTPITNAAQTATFVMFLHPVILFVLDFESDGGWVAFLVALIVPWLLARVLISRNWLPWLTGIRVGPSYPVSRFLHLDRAENRV